jgi:mRNA interferase RelE/StbE
LILLSKNSKRYTVLIDKRVQKDLENIPTHTCEKFIELLDEFEKDPIRPRPKFDVKILKGFPGNLYRLRIGDYRVLYSVDKDNKVVKITTIRHRKKSYKK